jgi:hypothetical protein
MFRLYYEEKQSFRQTAFPWLLGLSFVAMLVIFSYGFYQQLILKRPWGDEPTDDRILLVTGIGMILFMGLVFVLLLSSSLEIRISGEGFTYRFPPFLRQERTIRPEEIDHFSVQDNSVLSRYRGWGIHWAGGWRSWSFTVGGKAVLKIYYKNGRRMLFGTRKPVEIRKAMEDLMQPR